MKLDAVVFDLDGTLIDSFRDIAAALNHVLDVIGARRIPVERVRTMIGGGVRTLLERALDDPSLVDAAFLRFPDAYRARMLDTTCLFPGIDNMLCRLAAAEIPALVATNKPSSFAVPIVEGLRLPALGIVAVAGADEVPRKKPDPAVVKLALERAGVHCEPARVAYVGDMPIDRRTAEAFGGPFVGVGWGFDPGGLEEVVDDAEQLAEVLLGR